jgi:hypothetical protein
MPNRESLCQRWGNGWSQHSLRCPLHSRLGFTRPQRELLLNAQEQVIYQKRLPNHLPTILEPLSLHHSEIEGVVVESTYNWYWLVDG